MENDLKDLKVKNDASNDFYTLLPTVIIEKYFDLCDFDDTCDVCEKPEHGSYAVGLTNDECGIECDGYICGKCASKSISHIIEQQKGLDKHIAELEQEYKDNPPMMPQDLPAEF